MKLSSLTELKYFVKAVSARDIDENPSDIIKSSIFLLNSLPAARSSILDYFAIFFDEVTKSYVIEYHGKASHNSFEEKNVEDIKVALDTLIHNGSHSWAPLLSQWSLTLLGQILERHGRSCGVTAIQNVSNFWMNCSAINCLVNIATTCLTKLTADEIESAITVLLSTFVKHAPHFDWIVARLGNSFSANVIQRIVQFGLDGFAANTNSALESEIAILSELCLANNQALVGSLKRMVVQLFLNDSKNRTQSQHPPLIPYLIHLARSSPTLLQAIVQVFYELYNEGIITDAGQFRSLHLAMPMDHLHAQLTALAMNIIDHGTEILLILSRMDSQFANELLENVLLELEQAILDDHHLVADHSLLIDLLKDTNKPLLWRAAHAEGRPLEQQTAVRLILLIAPRTPYLLHQTVAELMTLPKMSNGALIRIIGGCLGSSLEQLTVDQGLGMTLERLLLNVNKQETSVATKRLRNEVDVKQLSFTMLSNLVALVELEKKQNTNTVTKYLNQVGFGKLLKVLQQYLRALGQEQEQDYRAVDTQQCNGTAAVDEERTRYKKLKVQTSVAIKKLNGGNEDDDAVMEKEEDDVINHLHLIFTLIDHLNVDVTTMGMSNGLLITELTVRTFFLMLKHSGGVATRITRTLAHLKALLARLCGGSGKGIKIAALRELIEGAIFIYRDLFGGPSYTHSSGTEEGGALESMMKQNQQQSFMTPATNRSVLHAGQIGHGLRAAEVSQQAMAGAATEAVSLATINHYLDAIKACCLVTSNGGGGGGGGVVVAEKGVIADGFSTVSLLLVEIISPDVMYNGLPWPEDEFMKVTIERDLQIRRMFKYAPILWHLLSLVATCRPALCYASVLLRALCATVLHQWRARSVERPFTISHKHPDLLMVTQRMLEIMSLGQLLPPPLNYLHVVIDGLDPTEVAIVLRDCVWNYMRDNVPAPTLFECTATGLVWRNPATSKPAVQYTDSLRRIMLKRLPSLGPMYHQMFVVPNELTTATTTTTTSK